MARGSTYLSSSSGRRSSRAADEKLSSALASGTRALLFHGARVEEMERSSCGWLFDVPAHMYKQAVLAVGGWLRQLMRGDRDRAFVHETALMFFAGFFRRRYEDFRDRGERGRLGEIGRFVRTLMRRLLGSHAEA